MEPVNIPVTGINQLVYKETRNILIANLVISCFLSWLTIPKEDVLTLLGGVGSAGFGFYPASFLFSSSVIVILSNMLRKNILTGKLVVDFNVEGNKVLKMLPRGVLVRAALIGLFCGLVIAPTTLIILNFTVGSEWTYTQAIILNVVYLEVLALVLVPVVVRTAVMNALLDLRAA